MGSKSKAPAEKPRSMYRDRDGADSVASALKGPIAAPGIGRQEPVPAGGYSDNTEDKRPPKGSAPEA